ncbi:MAG: T9SS type A sorting domain-containing protein, partial [Flavisolibacter sp.]
STPNAPSADVTQPTCTVATGTITVNSPDATLTYTLTGPSPATTTQSNSTGIFSSLAAGTYGLTATKGVCTSPSTSKTVNTQPSTPDKPTIVVTQPSLCGPSKGSIQICSPTAGWTYHIGSADITAQANTAVIFTDLSAGSNPVVTVTNTDGCTSSGSVCDDAVESCPSLTRIQQNSIIGAAEESELKVTAYPNPFNDKINFVVNAPVSGKGTLEVYNSLGQKIKTVYQGTINKGMQNFELRLPVRQQANLIYVLRVGGKQLSGKILQLNQ